MRTVFSMCWKECQQWGGMGWKPKTENIVVLLKWNQSLPRNLPELKSAQKPKVLLCTKRLPPALHRERNQREQMKEQI